MIVEDLIIVDLAAEVAELRDQVSLTESYRLMAYEAIDQLVERNRELEGARRRIASLVAELRDARGNVAA